MLITFVPAGGDTMAGSAASAVRLFASTRGNLLVVLGKCQPLPGNTGKGAVNNGCSGELRRYC